MGQGALLLHKLDSHRMLATLLIALYVCCVVVPLPSRSSLRRGDIPSLSTGSTFWGRDEYILKGSKGEWDSMAFQMNGRDQLDYYFRGGQGGFNILRGMFRLQVSNLDELGESVTLVPMTLPQPPNKASFRVELPEDMNKVRLIEDSP